MIWTYSGNSKVELATHGRGGPSNFAPQTVRRKAVLPQVNSRFQRVEDQGSALRVWAFGASKQHETESDAQEYLIRLHSTVPKQAKVWVELDGGGACYSLPDCCIDFSLRSLTGVRTRVAWTLSFGTKESAKWWIGRAGSLVFFDGVGGVNASGAPVDGHIKPAADGSWSWPVAPALGDFVFSDALRIPAWFDGVGWINFSGAPVDGHTRPAANGSYTRPADPAQSDMALDETLWMPIWRYGALWINATGAEA